MERKDDLLKVNIDMVQKRLKESYFFVGENALGITSSSIIIYKIYFKYNLNLLVLTDFYNPF
jgi:ABC-type cobalamin transport system permease subunit